MLHCKIRLIRRLASNGWPHLFGTEIHGRIFPTTNVRRSTMQDPLADGGVIRKLWIGEADHYRSHLLRLDGESRHSRFGGGVADAFIRNYAGTTFGLSAVVHGFFVDGVMRGAAELRPLGPAFAREAEVAFSIEGPWQSHGVSSACSIARCSPPATAASGNCTWPASPTTAACRSWPASSTPN
jgi:hypothetical protein